MRYAPGVLLIGSTGRNAGKTLLACGLLSRFAAAGAPLYAGKVTAVQERDGACPRGGAGCGVCASLDGDYCLTEEVERGTVKDTQRLLAAGARRVHWLRVLKARLESGADRLLAEWGGGPAVCESNSLREVIEPGLFIMCRPAGDTAVKASAAAVLAEADAIVTLDHDTHDCALDRFFLHDGAWHIRHEAGLLIFGHEPDPWQALAPHFDAVSCHRELHLSSKHILLQALRQSPHDVNLVAAAAAPVPSPRAIRRLLRAVRQGNGAAMPAARGTASCIAIHRRAIGPMEAVLAEGTAGMSELLTSIPSALVEKVKYP